MCMNHINKNIRVYDNMIQIIIKKIRFTCCDFSEKSDGDKQPVLKKIHLFGYGIKFRL